MEVCSIEELLPGKTKVVYLEGKQVGVFNIDGKIYAINNRCTHARGPLTKGDMNFEVCTVVCPWDYGKCDIWTGEALDGLVKKPVETFEVEIKGNKIYVGTKIKAQVR